MSSIFPGKSFVFLHQIAGYGFSLSVASREKDDLPIRTFNASALICWIPGGVLCLGKPWRAWRTYLTATH